MAFVCFCSSDWASLQVEENGVAQAAVQAAAQSCGGVFQDDASLQHPNVTILTALNESTVLSDVSADQQSFNSSVAGTEASTCS